MTTYIKGDCVVFCQTNEKWGEFSNLCAGFPISDFRASENLYQSCKFEYAGNEVLVQRIAKMHPYDAMKLARVNKALMRPDWHSVRVQAMGYAIRMKLAYNSHFGKSLLATGNRPIVELSIRDAYWGAKPFGNSLVGENMLGTLLMELRDQLRADDVEYYPHP